MFLYLSYFFVFLLLLALMRETIEVTENGACGGGEQEVSADMELLKDHEETSQKAK